MGISCRHNSVQFRLFCIALNFKFAPEGFTVCTSTTKPPRKNPFTQKKVKNFQEQQRRIPLQDRQKKNRCHVTRWTALQSYIDTFNEYDRHVWIISSRHGPRSRPPQSMEQKEEERKRVEGVGHQQGHGRRHQTHLTHTEPRREKKADD